MITEKEKMDMLKEVGMIGRVKKLEQQKEVEKLTQLKFIPTSYKRIEKQLSSWYFKINSPPSEFGLLMVIVGGFVSATFFASIVPPSSSSYIFIFATTVLFMPFAFWHKTAIVSKPLEEWEDNIPYGALLAIKEAKKAKLNSFEIYYPVTQWAARLMQDPVIVGWTEDHRIMMEVFAWDDGKIYE